MRGKLLGLVPVADGRGDAFNVGEHTNATSPTASSDACGKTNKDASNTPLTTRLEMGASDSPAPLCQEVRRASGSATRLLRSPPRCP
jgi:hypothetical protein